MRPRIYLEVTNDDLRRIVPVIVECWDHRKTLSGGRKYRAKFSPKERQQLAAKHKDLRRWYLVKGFPVKTLMLPATWRLLVKAANFFAGLR